MFTLLPASKKSLSLLLQRLESNMGPQQQGLSASVPVLIVGVASCVALGGIALLLSSPDILEATIWKAARKTYDLLTLQNPVPVLILAGGYMVALVLEAAIIGWNRSSLQKLRTGSGSARTDLIWGVVDCLSPFGLFAAIVSFGLSYAAIVWAQHLIGGGLLSQMDNPWLYLPVYVLCFDFISYSRHWVSHQISWWWEAHKYHHSAEEMTILTHGRRHPIDKAIQLIIFAVPVALLGIPADAALGTAAINSVLVHLRHSNLDWDFGWIGRWILVSPVMHRVHHSADPEHHGKNFGYMFVFWDRLFGTYYEGNKPVTVLGVPDNEFNRDGFLRDFWKPFPAVVKALVSRPER